MVAFTLNCQDKKYCIDRDVAINNFHLIKEYLDDFPDHDSIDLKVNSQEVALLLNKKSLDKVTTITAWQLILNTAEYLQCDDKIREDLHDVFADYMHYYHNTDMILTYEAYTYDDYRRKMADKHYKTDDELGVLNTFKQLWG